jgi:putative tricarboxylic transport membrane protein
MRAGFLLAILFLAGGYSYLAFSGLPYLSQAGRLGPGFFPRIIGASLVVLCVYSLYADARAARGGEALSPFWRTAVVVALLTAAFIVLLELLGGLASMIAFMAAALAFVNRGRHLQNLLLALVLPISVYLLFVVWLKAAMPRGLLALPF